MGAPASRTRDRRDDSLQALLRVIASRDEPAALRLLAAAPPLAREAVAVGASRHGPDGWFFPAIGHHAYAGDTALHLAAAACLVTVAEALMANGADVAARTGAAPSRCTTRPTACPGRRPGTPTRRRP